MKRNNDGKKTIREFRKKNTRKPRQKLKKGVKKKTQKKERQNI